MSDTGFGPFGAVPAARVGERCGVETGIFCGGAGVGVECRAVWNWDLMDVDVGCRAVSKYGYVRKLAPV